MNEITAPTPTERLRQAADRIDALAAAATPGPWTPNSHAELEKGCRCMSCYQPGWAWEVAEIDGPDCQDHGDDCHHIMRIGYDDAAYIAALHPLVGKALSAWLRGGTAVDPLALAVANAILGTSD